MAQEKILGKQLNVTTVASELAADPIASTTLANGLTLTGLGDVNIAGSPAAGHVLTFQGSPTGWVGAPAGGGDVTNPMTADLDTGGYNLITASTVAPATNVDAITLVGGNNTYDNFKLGGNQTIEYNAGNIVINGGSVGTAYSSDGKAYGRYGVNGGAGSPYVGVGSPNFPSWGNAPGVIRIKGGDGNRSEYFSYEGNVQILGGSNTHAYWTGYGGQVNIEGGAGYYGGTVYIFGGQANQAGVGRHGDVRIDGGFSYAGSPSWAAGSVIVTGGSTVSVSKPGNTTINGGSVRFESTYAGPAGWLDLQGGLASSPTATNGGDVRLAGGITNSGTQGGHVHIEPGRTGGGSGGESKVYIHSEEGSNSGSAILYLTRSTNNLASLAGRTFFSTALKVDSTLAADNVFALPANNGNTGDVLTMSQGSPPTTTWQAPAMPIYTVATLPAVVEGGMIYVSDATTGHAGSPASATGTQCFGRAGSPSQWIDVLTGLAVV